MTATDVWDDVAAEAKIPRDQWGRPLVVPAKGGKAKPYTRPSTLGDNLDDRYGLELWKLRHGGIGLARRPDLLALAAAHDSESKEDKKVLNAVMQEAIDASTAGAAANKGRALHRLFERSLGGEDISHIPADLLNDITAGLDCLKRHAFEIVHVEPFVVCEAIGAAGSPDLILRVNDHLVIGDWKSGAGAFEWGMGSIAVQTAVYAHSETMYDPATKTHTPLEGVDQSRAYMFHIPAGSAKCDLIEVDIVAGWQAAKLAMDVRAWRDRKNLGRSVTDAADTLDFERELIATRVRALPQGAVDFLARKVADHGGLPRVSQSAAAHLDVWADLLVEVEAEFEVPFNPPSKTTNRKRNT